MVGRMNDRHCDFCRNRPAADQTFFIPQILKKYATVMHEYISYLQN
jgi:hypothetical protein